MKIALRFFFLVSAQMIYASVNYGQGLNKAWDKIYSGNLYESFTGVINVSDHGLVVAGSSSSGAGGDKTQPNHDTSLITFDYWIVKTDSNGTLAWEKSFGGNLHEELTDIIETSDHGFLLAGTSMSDSSGDVTEPGRGSKDYWIVKTDSIGNKQWDRRFGGNSTDLLTCVVQTNDGGYLLGGTSLSPASGDKSEDNHNPFFLNYDYWVVKTDANGNKLWDNTIGGDHYDLMEAVIQIPSGDLLFGGYSRSPISGDKTDYCRTEADFWILRTDANGNILWDKTFGGDDIDWLFSMCLAGDGGFVLAGTSGSSDSIGERTAPSRGGWDYWVVKTDSMGNKLWDNAYGGAMAEEMYHVVKTIDNGFLFSGTSYSSTGGDKTEDNLGLEQGWLVKTDSNGIKEWDRTVFTYGHDESGYAIQTHEGCYVAGIYTEADTGGYKSWHNLVASDYWIVKFCYEPPLVSFISSDTVFCAKKCIDFFDLSTNNPTSWYWSFPGAVPAFSTDQNPTGICYNAYGTFDVTLTASNAYGSDSLLVTDFIIEYLFLPPVITVSYDTLFCSAAYSYQWFLDTTPIPGATGNYIVMNVPGSYWVQISDSLGCLESSELFTTGDSELFLKNDFSTLPNPSSGKFFIQWSADKEEKRLMEGFSLHGIQVFSCMVPSHAGFNRIPVDLSGCSPGVYFLRIWHESGISMKKILIN